MSDLAESMRRALAAYQRGNFADAEYLCRAIIFRSPDDPHAHHLLAVLLTRGGRLEEALAHFDMALSQQRDVQALSNRGVVLAELNRHEEAARSLTAALSMQPAYLPALSNLGNALLALGRYEEAREAFDRAVSLQADFAECRFNRARLLLLLGQFAEGWPEYEWRRKLRPATPPCQAPEWGGEDLRGRRLLLYAEQGLGDTIQFARFAQTAADRGAEVMLMTQPPIATLIGSLGGVAAVVPDGSPLPRVDFQLPLMSVPFVLALNQSQNIPASVPYLKADPARVARWATKLPEAGFRVGIAWQGSPRRTVDQGRSVPLRAFAPLAGIPGVHLVSLQKHDGVEQLLDLPLGMSVADLGGRFDAGPDALLDTAAVMMHLDLIVTVDTVIAHLAGALGRPVWIVLRKVPDWRWMLNRVDSPWYPTARLFRQKRAGDWEQVIRSVTNELAIAATSRRAG